jgi:hypothetical protein
MTAARFHDFAHPPIAVSPFRRFPVSPLTCGSGPEPDQTRLNQKFSVLKSVFS